MTVGFWVVAVTLTMASADHPLSYLLVEGKKEACCNCDRQTDHRHVCVVDKRYCCGMCKGANADGSAVDNLRRWVICERCNNNSTNGAGGGRPSTEPPRSNQTTAAARSISSTPLIPAIPPLNAAAVGTTTQQQPGTRTVTPSPIVDNITDAWPKLTEQQYDAALTGIGGPGGHIVRNINYFSRTMIFGNKKSMFHDNGIKPRNKSQCLSPVSHWVGVDTHEQALVNIYHWIHNMTKEEQRREKERAKGKNIKKLNTHRPAPLQSANNGQGDATTNTNPPRVSARVNQAAVQQLVARARVSTQDPGMQQRARAAAGPVGIAHNGVTSSAAQREQLVEGRDARARGSKKKRRKVGEYANSAGAQSDATSNRPVAQSLSKAAKAMDTMHFPRRGTTQPKRGMIVIEYDELLPPSAVGGRTAARKAPVPRMTMMTSERSDSAFVQGMLKEAAKQLTNHSSKKPMEFELIEREDGKSLSDQVAERTAAMKKKNSLPARKTYSDAHVQLHTINRGKWSIVSHIVYTVASLTIHTIASKLYNTDVVRNPREALHTPEK